jgi:hypothetical protein
MNTSLLNTESFVAELKSCWSKWQEHKKYYPNITLWWCRYMKRMIRTHFIGACKNRIKDRRHLENVCYETIYSILETKPLKETAYIKLQELRAKIVRIHNSYNKKLLLNLEEHDRNNDGIPSLYHLLKYRKRQSARAIPQVRGDLHDIQNDPYAILRVFTNEMKHKYETISPKGNSIRYLLRHVCKNCPLRP